MKKDRQHSAYVGAAGVFAVASRLCLLEHSPSVPTVDIGVDIVLENGLKIQVKAGHFRKDPRTAGQYYVVDAKRLSRSIGKRKGESKYVGVVDFLVYWAIDENRFFVFPMRDDFKGIYITSKTGAFKRLSTKCDSYQMVRDHEEAWHLLDVDAAVEEIEKSAVAEVLQEN